MKSDNLVKFCIAQVHHSMPEDTALDVELQHALLMLTSLISATPALSDRVCRLAIEKMNKRYVEALASAMTPEQLESVLNHPMADTKENRERFLGVPLDDSALKASRAKLLREFGPFLKPDEDGA